MRNLSPSPTNSPLRWCTTRSNSSRAMRWRGSTRRTTSAGTSSNAAVRLASAASSRAIACYAFPLEGTPDACPDGVSSRALRACVDAALQRFGSDPFRTECFWPVDLTDPYGWDPARIPLYESYVTERHAKGTYDHVVTFREHVRPLADALWSNGAGRLLDLTFPFGSVSDVRRFALSFTIPFVPMCLFWRKWLSVFVRPLSIPPGRRRMTVPDAAVTGSALSVHHSVNLRRYGDIPTIRGGCFSDRACAT